MTRPLGYSVVTGGSGGSDPTKADRYTTVSRTANFVPAAWTLNLIDTTSGTVTATFPSANVAGQQIAVKWVGGSNTASIARSGSDTFGAAATTANLALINEIWEFTSSGTGQWNLTGGNKTLSSLDGRYLSNRLASGEEVFSRELLTASTIASTASSVKMTHFTARTTESISQVRLFSGGTAAGATPTLCRVGVYELDSSGNGTLVASTVNDTTLFSATATPYTRSFSAPFTKVMGRRYAVGVLVVTAAAMPNFGGQAMSYNAEAGMDPRLSSQLAGQTDLPASFLVAGPATIATRVYFVLLP